MNPPRVLIIAGSDSSGGAGIQADIKTVTMLGGYAMTAITAITAQNTLGVHDATVVPPEMVLDQIEAVLSDIGVDAVKIGMIAAPEIAIVVAERLEQLKGVPIVFDPVMVASSGATLASPATIEAFERLMVLAELVTPNAPELTALTGIRIENFEQLVAAARLLAERVRVPILAKGGHLEGPIINDLLIDHDGIATRWEDERIDSSNTHGTGCTLASAIATGLGRGEDLKQAVSAARTFVRAAIEAAPGFGAGQGPMGHWAVPIPAAMNLNQVTVAADDYRASVAFYTNLGLRQIVDSPPNYARFECPGGTTFSLHAGDQPSGTIIYFESPDLDAWVDRLKAAGVEIQRGPADQPWLWREARLYDPAGNEICLFKAGANRRFPPWRME